MRNGNEYNVPKVKQTTSLKIWIVFWYILFLSMLSGLAYIAFKFLDHIEVI